MRGLLQAIGAGLALAAFAADAVAQVSDSERQVRGYLEYGLQRHAALGYAADSFAADLVMPLRLDHPYLWTVNLRAGVNYRIYAACDDNCADLDMELYGADGQLADRDVGRDDTPYVQITPARSGRYNVRVWLFSCRADACTMAARVVSGGTPAARESTPVSIAPPAPAPAPQQ